MKVFISWSGSTSKKVAQIFRDWLPSVIQSIEPFVSSEDIEKGSRWNTDIAQELKESTFGIICVTKDNLLAPWLNFEAGALSKIIDNSYVAPFLFDVKPSELTGSPISQFQATSFVKDDLKRLVETLNVAAGNCLLPPRLEQAFNVWYSKLEENLNTLRSEPSEVENSASPTATNANTDIFEELLETSRNTQRLLGNTDMKLYNGLELLQKKIDEQTIRNERQYEIENKRIARRFRSTFVEELLYSSKNGGEFYEIYPYNLLIVLSIFRDDFPWLYDAGQELIKVIQSNASKEKKSNMIDKFKQLIDFTWGHPIMREAYGNMRKDSSMMLRDISMMLIRSMDRLNEKDII